MNLIRDISGLQPGDVLYHSYLGFAVVEDVDEGGAGIAVAWEDPDAEAPSRVPSATLIEEFRLCVPGGFLSRSVSEQAALADLVALDPARAMTLLLEDIGEALDVDAVRRWVVGRDLLPEAEFDRWWAVARRELHENPGFTWVGGRLALVRTASGPTGALPEAFLRVGARRRFEALDLISTRDREIVLDAAIQCGDIDAALLILRGWSPLPGPALTKLRALIRGGESRVAAALLDRGQPEILDDFSVLIAEEDGRSLLRESLDRLSRSRRSRAIESLRARVARAPHPDAARRFLDGLPNHPPRLGAPSRHADADFETMETESPFDLSDTTAAVQVEMASTLITQLAPVPAHRVLSLSIALSRALATRHAHGEAGGLLGARVRAGGTIELGAPEDSSPRRDVRDAVRLIADLAIGRHPPGPRVDDEHILAHLALLVPGLSPDWVAVATRALAMNEALRPADGLDLWTQLERAAAVDRVRSSAPPRPTARMDVAHDTHIGLLKSRLGQVNQDAVFWYTEGATGLLVVADGISISTAGSGDLASSILVRVMVALWEQNQERLASASTEDVRIFLDQAFATANQAICNASVRMAGGDLGQHIPMGTTALVGLVQGATIHIATLGDSRVFLTTQGGVAQVTGDQNLRGEWLQGWQRGRPTDLIGDGHALTGYSGHFNEHLQPEPVPPVQRTITMLPGETLLMCSDGFTDYAADTNADIALLVEEAAAKEDLGDACRGLVAYANARGGGDNVTVLMARLSG